MRLLGVDLGDKRTGLALADTRVGLVEPLRVVERPIDPPQRLLDALAEAVDEFEPDCLVLGLPVNMDGTEGPRAKVVRVFAGALSERVGAPVSFHDERLSSAQADWEMARSGLTRGKKKERRDALAAAAILRSFLEQGGEQPGSSDEPL